MKKLSRVPLFALGLLLCASSANAQVLPQAPVAPVEQKQEPHALNNLVLNYDGATTNSRDVLDSKVTVELKNVPFLVALDTVMQASSKTCRVECRELMPLRVSMKVKDSPVAKLLHSLATLSGARLYVLPSKLIIAPETALTEEEKKTARPYAVLLTAATLPNAKAFSQPNVYGMSILDQANSIVSQGLEDTSLKFLVRYGGGVGALIRGYLRSYFTSRDLEGFTLTFTLNKVRLGDALASYAYLLGLELYLTPNAFVICAPEKLTAIPTPDEMQGAVLAFQPFVGFDGAEVKTTP